MPNLTPLIARLSPTPDPSQRGVRKVELTKSQSGIGTRTIRLAANLLGELKGHILDVVNNPSAPLDLSIHVKGVNAGLGEEAGATIGFFPIHDEGKESVRFMPCVFRGKDDETKIEPADNGTVRGVDPITIDANSFANDDLTEAVRQSIAQCACNILSRSIVELASDLAVQRARESL